MFEQLFIFLIIFHHASSHDSNGGYFNPDPSSKDLYHDDIYEINSKLEKKDKIPTQQSDGECPDMRTCSHDCVMGHVVGPDGCEICELCVTEGLMESDIVVDDSSYKDIEKEYGAGVCDREKQRGASRRKELEWPKSGKYVTIGYTFHHSVSKSKKENIKKAIREYRKKTCIRFKPRTTQKNYIQFVGDETRGCSSYVGRQRRGSQDVTIGRNCDRQLGTIIHELMHALGFWHEQSRGDRDKYVQIKVENIISSAKHNFQKRTSKDWNSYGSPYDVNSVMHYGGFFFSNGQLYGDNPTIVDRKTKMAVVAQRKGFSPEDIKQINTKYKCTDYLTSGKSTPRPTTTPTTAPPRTTPRKLTVAATSSAGSCRDLRTRCKRWKEAGYCRNSGYVQKRCKKSCGKCSAGNSAKRLTTTRRPVTRSTTTTTRRPPTTTKTQEVCKDNQKSCGFWKQKNYCKEKFVVFMRTNCKLSCGLCRAQTNDDVLRKSDCQDRYDSCENWATSNFCKSGDFVSFMRKHCKLSCSKAGVSGLCDYDFTTTTAATTPLSTTLRVKERVTSQCKDTQDQSKCNEWANQGFCTDKEHRSFMRKYCRKSCGFCKTNIGPKLATAEVPYKGCGVPEVDLKYRLQQRIVGGIDALHGAIPWIVSLRRNSDYEFCAGSLINRQFIVTAAHCFYDKKDKLIKNAVNIFYGYLGKHHSLKKEKGQIKILFSDYAIHPDYNHFSSDNDIAIMKISKPVTFTKFIKPVCLPTNGQSVKEGAVALVAGWGKQERSYLLRSDILQQVDVEIIDNKNCKTWMAELGRQDSLITDNMICAGYMKGGKDACQGDSGGPLTLKYNRKGAMRHVLVGVVSWGYGCADERSPGLYAKVSTKINWIKQTMKNMSSR